MQIQRQVDVSMTLFQEFWNWLNTNGTALGIFITTIPIAWGATTFLMQKSTELKHKEFETYHNLLDELIRGSAGVTYIDRQMAVIYELRKFKRYYQITLRILKHLRNTWNIPDKNVDKDLIDELDLAITYIRRRDWKQKFSKKDLTEIISAGDKVPMVD